jgi:hypothetical protein
MAHHRPAAAELERLGAHVAEAPLAELGLRPALRLTHAGRVGQPSADPVGEVKGMVHHLALSGALGDDPVDLGSADVLRESRGGEHERKGGQRNGGQGTAHLGIVLNWRRFEGGLKAGAARQQAAPPR